MRVFTALLVDAYRELNSKKLFWVVLGISALVVLVYGSIGFGDSGMSMFFGIIDIESEFLTRDSPLSRLLYRSIFSTFIVGLWLAWVAVILALISTTTIFPDFMASGSIDIVLAKPVRRITLFAMKYFTSLLFVILQVGIFCVGIFLCLGLRLGDWDWRIFIAVPLLTLFFSYLFSVNVLVGVRTRSALTALLITLLLWFSLFGINLAEGILNTFHTQFTIDMEKAEEQIATIDARIDRIETADPEAAEAARAAMDVQREMIVSERDLHEENLGKIRPWYTMIRVIQTIGPKTSGTVELIDSLLVDDSDVALTDILSGNVRQRADGTFGTSDTSRERERLARMQEEYDQRNTWWYIVGTSLIFEFVVLGLAAWVFVRRDY